MNAITLGTSSIRQLDGLYSLNDLHQAAGGESKHRPNYFLELQQTKELTAEIEKAGIPAISAKPRVGTYVCRELVYAYANWISAAFYLRMIRAFDAQQSPRSIADTFRDGRWLAHVDDRGMMIFTPIPRDAHVLNFDEIDEHLARFGKCIIDQKVLAELMRQNDAIATVAERFAGQVRKMGAQIVVKKNPGTKGATA